MVYEQRLGLQVWYILGYTNILLYLLDKISMHGFVVTSLNNNTHAKVFWILDPCYQFQNYMTERLLEISLTNILPYLVGKPE